MVDLKKKSPILSKVKTSNLQESRNVYEAKVSGEDPFTLEKIKQNWTNIIKVLEKEAPRLFNMLKKPNLDVNGNQVRVIVAVEHHKKLIDSKLPYLRASLQRSLNNKNTDVEILVESGKAAETELQNLFTSKDKYTYFAKQNEAFLDLVKQFDLQI